MKEVLFNFDEFRERAIQALNDYRPSHYGFKRTPIGDGLFVGLGFRIYCRETQDNILVFEKTASYVTYEEEKIKAFSDECKEFAKKVSATPGYFEEDGA
jgi:hypothetical protein